MAFLHQAGIRHHDCKSANVLIDEDWTAKLCDFGMATGIGMTSLSLVNTSSRNRSGTYRYSAPEALSPETNFVYDNRCEVYTLGLIIWEVLTGGVPYANASGAPDTFPQLVKKVVTDGTRPPSPSVAQLMERSFLWDKAQHAWKQDPKDRPSYAELATSFAASAANYPLKGARDWSIIKQCVMRVGVYSKSTQKLLDVGSGTLVSRDDSGCKGHVLTAAHVLINPTTLLPREGPVPSNDILYESASGVVMLLGEYEADDLSSKWKYWAEVKTPFSVLQQQHGGGLLDLAILKIGGTVSMTPDIFMHTGGAGLSADTYTLQSQGMTPPSFSVCLPVGDPSSVVTGDPLPCIGWATPNGQTTIFVADDHSLLSKENGYLKSQAFMHSAMSGGPMLNHKMEVVAVNSQSRTPAYGTLASGTLVEPATYAGWGRMTDLLTPAHWG